MGYNALIQSKAENGRASGIPEDFRRRVLNPNSVVRSDYANLNIAKRIGVGSPGSRQTFGNQAEKTNYTLPYASGEDLVNLSDIENNISTNSSSLPGDVLSRNKDIIKFCFETLNNDNPDISNATFFRAFLTGYQDSHSAEWASKKYTGRGENFYTYQGHDRTVSFNFKVAAQSRREMRSLYRKLNYLLSTLYPDYSSAGFMRGNITKLTIGDLFVRTPGILTDLNLTVDDEYAWEIVLNEQDSNEMLETPQIINVAVTFKPILDQLPRTGPTSRILVRDVNNRYLDPIPNIEA
jgi:hypothetical protein